MKDETDGCAKCHLIDGKCNRSHFNVEDSSSSSSDIKGDNRVETDEEVEKVDKDEPIPDETKPINPTEPLPDTANEKRTPTIAQG